MVNIEALLELHRKNAAAWTEANRIVFDGLKTFAQRERDVLQSTLDDYTNVTRDLLTGTSVAERATKQVDVAGRIFASNVAHFVELSNIAVNTNVSALDILNARVTGVFEEFRALFTERGKTATSAEPSITAEPVALAQEVALIENALPAVPSTPTGTPKSAPRTARAAKASKTSASGSKAASKTTARAAKPRRGTSRK
jgi:phasin family protein